MSPLRQRVRDLEQCLHDASEQVASLKLEGTARVGVMRRLEKQLLVRGAARARLRRARARASPVGVGFLLRTLRWSRAFDDPV